MNDCNQNVSWEGDSAVRRLGTMMLLRLRHVRAPEAVLQRSGRKEFQHCSEGSGAEHQSSIGFGIWLGKLLGLRVRLEQIRVVTGSYWFLSCF